MKYIMQKTGMKVVIWTVLVATNAEIIVSVIRVGVGSRSQGKNLVAKPLHRSVKLLKQA